MSGSKSAIYDEVALCNEEPCTYVVETIKSTRKLTVTPTKRIEAWITNICNGGDHDCLISSTRGKVTSQGHASQGMIRALRLLRLFRRPDEWLRLQILVDLRGHHRPS